MIKNFRSKMTAYAALFVCAALALMPGCGGKTAAEAVYVNGIIYTVDGDDWHTKPAEAIAVGGNGTIMFVGTSKGAKAYIGSQTQVIDLAGRVVFPGFTDMHCHIPGVALIDLFGINLYNAMGKDQTLAAIRDHIEKHPDKDLYWGMGYSVTIGDDDKGRGPTKGWLDEICADKPIILMSSDGHNSWLNSAAFAAIGITKDTPNPVGGDIRKTDNGELWGTMQDCGMMLLGPDSPIQFTDEMQLEAIALFQKEMHSWGYTSVMAIAPNIFVSSDLFKTFEDRGELAMRLNLAGYMTQGAPEEMLAKVLPETLAWRDELKDSKLLKVSTMKYFGDGVIEGESAYLFEPYSDNAEKNRPLDYRGEFNWDPEYLKKHFTQVIAAGLQIHVHSIGDGSTYEALNALEYAQAQNPGKDPRNVLTHLQLVRDSDKTRMGRLGIIAQVSPFWHIKQPDWFEEVEVRALGNRTEIEYPLKSFMDAGVRLTFSGDYPVSPHNYSFWGLQAAVTRNLYDGASYGVEDITDMDDPRYLLNAAERISLKDAVEIYTMGGAYQLFRENEVGSITAGKFADFIVVDQNIFARGFNPVDIGKTRVLATIFNGQVVYGGL